jgi:predicted MFS family arabinose efflux permease
MRTGLLLGFGPGAALGAGRFAYALVLPAMQAALQLSFAEAGLLGSANTAGYFLGALISHRVLAAGGYRRVFYTSLILQAVTLLLLAFGPALPVILTLRLIQGMLGAFVFVGGAALLLASGSSATGLGMYFGGVGLGITLSTIILPFLRSWQAGWLLLGILSLLMTLLAFLAAPALQEPKPPVSGKAGSLRPIAPTLVAYGLYGAGYIGYMTFVTTGLAVSLAWFWAVLGVGAILTGFVWGALVERAGGALALRVILLVLFVSSLHALLLRLPFVSAFLFGVSFLGVITAITYLFRMLLPAGAWPRAMGLSTAVFALGQAAGPTLSGLAGDAFGGATGALGAASSLLAGALLVSLLPLSRRRRRVRPAGRA